MLSSKNQIFVVCKRSTSNPWKYARQVLTYIFSRIRSRPFYRGARLASLIEIRNKTYFVNKFSWQTNFENESFVASNSSFDSCRRRKPNKLRRVNFYILFSFDVHWIENTFMLRYKLVRTSVLNPKQSLALQKYEEEYDFWRPARAGMTSDIMVPPGTKFLRFAQNMHREGIDFSVIIPDIGALIDNQRLSSRSAPYDGKISFDQYYPHDELNAYIDDLAATNDFISTVSIGQSHEGRDMRVLQITKAGPGKPNVWIEAGIHARGKSVVHDGQDSSVQFPNKTRNSERNQCWRVRNSRRSCSFRLSFIFFLFIATSALFPSSFHAL